MEAETMITEVYLLCYPVRLSPIEEEYKKSNLRVLHPNRNYTVTSILVCFFFMCFVGWIWEVSLTWSVDSYLWFWLCFDFTFIKTIQNATKS